MIELLARLGPNYAAPGVPPGPGPRIGRGSYVAVVDIFPTVRPWGEVRTARCITGFKTLEEYPVDTLEWLGPLRSDWQPSDLGTIGCHGGGCHAGHRNA